jgi:hypothetical protein
MTETLLPDRLTPCAPADLYASLRRAWPDAGRSSLLVLLSHWALETGFGHYCHLFNLGNAKHVPGDGHDYTQFRCNEIIGGKVVWISPPDPGCSFVAFPDLDTGAAYYLGQLRGRFQSAWPFVEAGDVVGFCHALKLAHYYTADEGLYTAGVTRCYHQLDGTIPPDAPSEAVTEPDIVATTGQPDEPHTA